MHTRNDLRRAHGPIIARTVAARAYDALRDRIIRGDLPEGMPLRQDALAAELGVSRIPVREALRQLEAEGLVTFRPYAGAVVSTLSIAEIEELFSLRALIETDVLGRAVGHLNAEHLERAEEVLEAFEDAFRRRDVSSWGTLNWEFHSTLYAVAAQPLTMSVLEMLHHHCERYTRAQLSLTRWEGRAMREHRAILDLVRVGDRPGAKRLLRSHILSAGEAMAVFLREQREAVGSARAGEGA
jgi:DNA-binding GntR family transcriptional regulator